MIKLVLSDMDGTLLPFGEKIVSGRTRNAIRAAQEAGIHFGPASGRDRAALLVSFAGDEKCVRTGIMGNGKQVYLDGELILHEEFDAAAIAALAKAVLPFRGCFVMVNAVDDPLSENAQGLCLGIASDDEDALATVAGARQKASVVSAIPHGLAAISGGVFIDERHANADEVRAALKAAAAEVNLDFLQPAPFFLDVIPRGWTKASALPALLDALGLDLDEVAFIGDSENDLTMMRAVPHAYAVANATPEAKAAAGQIIASAQDDAVAQYLERLTSQKQKTS